MFKAFKYRLYPNKEQKTFFSNSFGATRFIYNQMLADRISNYEKKKYNEHFPHKDTVNGFPVHAYKKKVVKDRTYTSFKHEYEFLKEVDNLALANAQMDLNSAYKKFFNKGSGFPKFKSKKKNRNNYKTNNQSGNIRIEGNQVKLPKIGFVKLKYHREFNGKIKSCTVSQMRSGKYYISILVEMIDIQWVPLENKIGIDLGIADFAITTNDDGVSKKYKNPKWLRKAEKDLIKAQKLLSRKEKGSKNREKARIKLAKKHEKIANQRKDFLHKLSYKITNENQVIVIETLKSSNMLKNRKLSKSISDVSWYEFTRQLEYKAEWLGRTIIKADQWFASSQICNECHHIDGRKELDVRDWVCPECGVLHDRDINASKNLLSLAL